MDCVQRLTVKFGADHPYQTDATKRMQLSNCSSCRTMYSVQCCRLSVLSSYSGTEDPKLLLRFSNAPRRTRQDSAKRLTYMTRTLRLASERPESSKHACGFQLPSLVLPGSLGIPMRLLAVVCSAPMTIMPGHCRVRGADMSGGQIQEKSNFF